MTEEIDFNTLQEFLEYNGKIIRENYYAFYSAITFVQGNDITLYKSYNLKGSDGSNAICMHISGNYFIFSTKWNNTIIDKLSNKIRFYKFKSFTFSGQKDLMLKLLDFNKVKYVIEKDRLVYECNTTNDLNDLRGDLVLAEEEDIEKLSEMSYEFQLEEYGDKAYRDYEFMSNVVRSGIAGRSIYKLIKSNSIYSMAQIVNKDNELPMIGHLFTDKKYRNEGFATSIVFQLTKLLLRQGYKKCGLVSDSTNIYSNKLFQKVGYKSVFKELSIYKEDS